MPFDPRAYGESAAHLFSLDGDGERLMPLVQSGGGAPDARREIHARAPGLFDGAAHPQGALAGIWLHFSCFDEAHSIAQEDLSAEGSYWHAIIHRQEPDSWNSKYWFRRAGRHAVFPALRDEAADLATRTGAGFRVPPTWDPAAFVDFCELAVTQPGSDAERLALQIQRAEWRLLFDFCASRPSQGRKSS